MGLYITSEILLNSIGIVIFSFFGLKIEIWAFYKGIFFDGKMGRILETATSSFDMTTRKSNNNNTTQKSMGTNNADEELQE